MRRRKKLLRVFCGIGEIKRNRLASASLARRSLKLAAVDHARLFKLTADEPSDGELAAKQWEQMGAGQL